MSRHSQIKAKSGNNEVTFNDHETDSPIVPIAQIERLHLIRPDKVDWIFQQTEAESTARRQEAARLNTLIFIERLAGVIFAFLIASIGLAGSIWLASLGNHEISAAAIGGTTLVSMVSAFIYSGKRK
ncbi:hypothetical protein [Methylomonas sp. AM2-LC]|uniref:hypothetical protein n=1 Tax=Methylomonas sp. AM2-LC TaxID=3153301 RepID=UPI003265F1C7